MSDDKTQIYKKALERERLARKQAEKILEQKSLELFEKTEELASINENLAQVIDEQTIEFNGIFDSIMDSYILMDLHGNVLKMNETAKEFFGYDIKKEKFNVTDIIYEEDHEYAYESFYQLIEVGFFENYQARVYTKTGVVKWVAINSRIIRDGETEPRFAHGIVRDITELKEQQEAFDAQKLQLDAIVDNSTVGIVLTIRGKVLRSNKAFQDMIGYEEEELVGMTVRDVSFGEDEESSYMYINKLMTGELDNFSMNKRYISKSGDLIWAKTSVAAVRNSDGTIKYEVAIIEDITEEKSRREAFEEQKEQLDTIVDNSSVGIVLTLQGRVIRTNAAFQSLVGYSEEELSKMTVVDVALESDKEETLKNVHAMIAGEIDDFTMNKQYLAKNGQIIWGRTHVSAVRDDEGAIKYEVSVIEDITEELKQEALLEALNNLMASILGRTNMYEIAWEITKNTIGLLGFEDCVIYLLDKEKGELNQIAAYGEKLSFDDEIVNKITIPLGKGIVGTVAQTGIAEIIPDTSKDERYIVDDKVRYSEISVPIVAENEMIGVIDSEHSSKNFFTKDHLKTLQTIASLAATQLKSALSLQLREKAEREKEQVLKDLQKSNQELNDFAHVVSHDLKSPLRSMNTLVNWIKEDSSQFASEEINKNFDMLLRRIDRMDLMINGILNYASIDKVGIVNKKIELQVIVDDILDSIHIPDNFSVTVKHELPIVKGDSYKYIQLFQNLISNAVKYSDKDHGVIEIGCVSKGKFWQFHVSDNGIGIPEKYQEKVFQIFQVLQESDDSTGVGLSIVKKVVDFYNGKVWVESKVGEGTTFYFTLPK
jgi:PAS domain S-box-containing protein